jgi:hypothetical protein
VEVGSGVTVGAGRGVDVGTVVGGAVGVRTPAVVGVLATLGAATVGLTAGGSAVGPGPDEGRHPLAITRHANSRTNRSGRRGWRLERSTCIDQEWYRFASRRLPHKVCGGCTARRPRSPGSTPSGAASSMRLATDITLSLSVDVIV